MGQGLRRTFPGGAFAGKLLQGLGNTRRTKQVHLYGPVQGRVESHSRRSVDHDVTRPEQCPTGRIEGQTVSSHVASDRVETVGDHGVETLAELTAEPGEAVVAQDLPPRAFRGFLVLAGPDDDDDLTLGHAAEQTLD